jgi:hypothetical protein
LSKRTSQAGLGNCGLRRPKAVERAGDRHQGGALRLKDLPDRALGLFRVLVRLGAANALVEQPGVQLGVTRRSQAWCEQPLANIADLVLHLPLLPPRRRRAGDGLDQMMPGTAKPLEFLYAFKEKRRRQTRLYEWQRWVAPKDDQIDRVHSDKKSALKDWFRAHGLTSGYLMGASV